MPDHDAPKPAARFMTIAQVAEELATSQAQVNALIRRRELRAFQLGGRGQWRIGRDDLEAYIAKAYAETQRALEQSDDADEQP